MKRKHRHLVALLLAALLLALGACAMAEGAPVQSAPPAAIDLTPLFQALIAVLAALVTGRLLPWIKARTSKSQQQYLSATANMLVYAAQQLYKTGVIQDRLQYVEDGLRARGFAADRDAIEAAVKSMKLADSIVTVPVGIQE